MGVASDATTHLREVDLQRWERDGYLVFDPRCPLELIDAAREDLQPHYVYEGEVRTEDGVVYSPGNNPRIRDAWRISENVKAIALLPRVIGVLGELYGQEPRPFQTLNFPFPTEQAPHADAMHFNTDPPGLMCGVWIAFEDIDMDNGPLVYYPGSHRLPFERYADVGFDANKEDFANYDEFIRERNRHYEQHVAREIEEHGLTPEYGTIKKGEALIWSANLIHGGSPRRDPNRTRHSQVTHYLFGDVSRYFTEMQTEGPSRVWKTPNWVG